MTTPDPIALPELPEPAGRISRPSAENSHNRSEPYFTVRQLRAYGQACVDALAGPMNEVFGNAEQLASLEQRALEFLQEHSPDFQAGETRIHYFGALRAITAALSAQPREVAAVPSEAAFASAMWRDWMTNEQADRLGAEIRSWVMAHISAAPQPRVTPGHWIEIGKAQALAEFAEQRSAQRRELLAVPQPREVRGVDIYMAYETWPEDIRKKLSFHDLRRMGGWSPKPNPNPTDWRIDTSAGGPILVYQDCSVIEGEQARYLLRLIQNDTSTTPQDAAGAETGCLPFETVSMVADALTILGGAVPEGGEEKAARADELVRTLCHEVGRLFSRARDGAGATAAVWDAFNALEDASFGEHASAKHIIRPYLQGGDVLGWRLVDGMKVFGIVPASGLLPRQDFVRYDDHLAALTTPPQDAAGVESTATHERGALAEAIANAGIKCGLLRKDIEGLTGPQLLMVCDDMASAITTPAPGVDVGKLRELHQAASKGVHLSETCGPDRKYQHVIKFPDMAALHAYENAWTTAMRTMGIAK